MLLYGLLCLFVFVAGVLPCADAAMWPVLPTCAGCTGLHGDEKERHQAKRHHVWPLQQGKTHLTSE